MVKISSSVSSEGVLQSEFCRLPRYVESKARLSCITKVALFQVLNIFLSISIDENVDNPICT